MSNHDSIFDEIQQAANWRIVARALTRFFPDWRQSDVPNIATAHLAVTYIGNLKSRMREAREKIEELGKRVFDLTQERDELQKHVKELESPKDADIAGQAERWCLIHDFFRLKIPGFFISVQRILNEIERLYAIEEACKSAPADVDPAPGNPIHQDAPTQRVNGQLSYPQWSTSHTRHVVQELERVVDAMKHNGAAAGEFDRAVKAATELLRDYHATQHVVYERAEKAEAELRQTQEALQEERMKPHVHVHAKNLYPTAALEGALRNAQTVVTERALEAQHLRNERAELIAKLNALYIDLAEARRERKQAEFRANVNGHAFVALKQSAQEAAQKVTAAAVDLIKLTE